MDRNFQPLCLYRSRLVWRGSRRRMGARLERPGQHVQFGQFPAIQNEFNRTQRQRLYLSVSESAFLAFCQCRRRVYFLGCARSTRLEWRHLCQARLHGMLKGRQDTSGLQGNLSGTGDANYLVVEGQLGLRYSFGGSPRAQSPDEDLFSSDETSPFGDPSDDPAFGSASPLEETDPFAAGAEDTADSGIASDEDMQEYIRLKSLSDELTQGIELKEREISSLQETLFDRRTKLGELESGKISASNGADRNVTQPRMDTGALTGSTASFSLAYERGLSLLTAKRYQDAINIFSDLVARFPSHALASHCHYWNGEAYFNLGNYQAAITALNNVLQSSLSLKKDNALLYLGRSYVQLNRTDEARRVFNQLIQEYPSSEFVGTAEEMLAKL
ncbi:MAG: outer membrane protein assembly factor BamD [Chlorobi bacterium CHB1]|nr:outer membrane protein assembly factor BamD [Chlorobi bacterium CHB1]